MKIFIGCSSSNNLPSKYYEDCKKFLSSLMMDNDLVFGACNSGLMQVAYETALNLNNKIIGICPEAYKHDFNELKCTEEIITNSVSSRTDSLITNSDALVFLPGGFGTICELFSSIENKRCHEFDKPIVIYNSCGFYDKLLTYLEKLYEEKYTKPKDRCIYFVSDNESEIINYIENYNSKVLERR